MAPPTDRNQSGFVGSLRPLRRFSLAAWHISPVLALAQVAITVLQGVVPATTLWAGSSLVNVIVALHAHRSSSLAPALPWVAALAGTAVIGNLAGTLNDHVMGLLRARITLRQEQMLLEAATEIDFVRFEQVETYDLMQRARTALGYRLTNLLIFLTRIISEGVTLVAYTALLWSAHPLLAVVVVLPVVPSMVLKVRATGTGYTHDFDATPIRRLMAYVFGLLLSDDSGQEVRVFGLFDELMSRWRAAHARWRAETLAKSWTKARAAIGTTAAQVVAYAVAVAILAALIAAHRLSLGDYVVLTGAASAFQTEMELLLMNAQDVLQDLPVLRDLQTFLDLGATARAHAGTTAFPHPLRRGLEVQGLTFRYPGSDQDAVKDVSFRVRPGETIAIVGPNGAGKSSLIKLLLGLYPPDAGTIRYDGIGIEAIAPMERARSCAAVFQDFARFRRPIREELAPGAPDLQHDDKALWAVLGEVGLSDRLGSLTAGLDTFLDPSLGPPDTGVELSGGEWQKVAIGRALARDAQVLALDEPTAALDPQAEVEVYQRFAELAHGRMTFLVSHRIGSARLADRILVIEGGRIVEDGTHSELLRQGGLYARFFEAQARWYQDKPPGEDDLDA